MASRAFPFSFFRCNRGYTRRAATDGSAVRWENKSTSRTAPAEDAGASLESLASTVEGGARTPEVPLGDGYNTRCPETPETNRRRCDSQYVLFTAASDTGLDIFVIKCSLLLKFINDGYILTCACRCLITTRVRVQSARSLPMHQCRRGGNLLHRPIKNRNYHPTHTTYIPLAFTLMINCEGGCVCVCVCVCVCGWGLFCLCVWVCVCVRVCVQAVGVRICFVREEQAFAHANFWRNVT
jgi:hypothetical protein